MLVRAKSSAEIFDTSWFGRYHGVMTDTSKPRGPYAKTAAKRAAVARAAYDVVIEKGHRGLTTAEVAERAGISERAMLYHFPSRDHLLIAAMQFDEQRNAERAQDRELSGSEDALYRIPQAFARQGMQHAETLRLFSYLASAAQDPEHPAHDYMRAHNAAAVEGFASLVRSRQRKGLAHPDIDPETAARQMLGAWNGLQSQWLIDPSFDLADEVTQAFRRLSGQPTMEARALLDDLLTRI